MCAKISGKALSIYKTGVSDWVQNVLLDMTEVKIDSAYEQVL